MNKVMVLAIGVITISIVAIIVLLLPGGRMSTQKKAAVPQVNFNKVDRVSLTQNGFSEQNIEISPNASGTAQVTIDNPTKTEYEVALSGPHPTKVFTYHTVKPGSSVLFTFSQAGEYIIGSMSQKASVKVRVK